MNYSNLMREEVSERLTFAMEKKRINQTKLVELTGLNKSAVSSYINGKYEPKSNAIKVLAEALDVSPAWLAGFDVPMERNPAKVFKPESLSFKIPFINQKLSAGAGMSYLSDDDIVVKTLDITADLPRSVDPTTLVCAEVVGDSMINIKLYSGDIVIFSRGMIRGEGIYVLALYGEVIVKRLEFNRIENKVNIISENEKYPVQVVDADNENVIILGKVIKWLHLEP